MNPAVLALALVRWGEAIRKRYANVTGRRALQFFTRRTWRAVAMGPEANRQARRAGGTQASDFKDVIAALRSTERAFRRTP